MEGMRMIPFKKLRCVSSICLMSFAQVILISGEDARRMKRCMLPSILRDVNTIRQGSSGQRSSMPKQLIYERYKYRNKHLSSYLFGFQSSTFSSAPHLDADFIDVSWQGKAFLAVDWLTEDDKLLEEEHPSLFGTGEDAVLILNECEGVLLQEFPLCSQLTLWTQSIRGDPCEFLVSNTGRSANKTIRL